MSSLQPVLITGYSSGLVKNKKPFLIIDDAFQELFNCYVWREAVKRREGIKLVGRLRRCFTTNVPLSTQANGASYNNPDILNDPSFGLRATEPNAEIEPGSLVVTVGAIVFTEPSPPNGVLSDGGTNTGTINYNTGELNLNFNPPLAAPINVDIQFCYFPALPVMGIDNRELSNINNEQTVLFDTKYAYTWDGNNFNSPSTSVWSGTDSDFFWMSNWRGITAQSRLLFVTNNASPVSNINNRIRHTPDAVTWTDFTPPVAGTTITNENVGTVVAPWTNFAAVLGNLPIIPGTVTITLSNGVNPTVGYRDQVDPVLGYPNGILNGSPPSNNGTINYQTGAITLNINPALTVDTTVLVTYQYETSYMWQAKLIIPYYGRLLAFNVYEGPTAATSTNIYNRCRFSQIGDPLQQDAWISTTPGKGGFIDAPTSEEIVSVQFYKNTLIVFFERSTWQLRYVGNVGLPFLWERNSSDLGSESTFSTVLFDDGVLAIGDKGIVVSNGSTVKRIDEQIPDNVFEFNNTNGGRERVHSVRDFLKEVVYWSYSYGGKVDQKFPNRVLLYNYKNNTFAIYRDNVTAFGELRSLNGISWDLPIEWDSETPWDAFFVSQFEAIIAGNQQGFIHWYQYPDSEAISDSDTNMNEQESLSISAITLSAALDIEMKVVNHNLEPDEIIYITGLLFTDNLGAPIPTSLNDSFYQVAIIDNDNIRLKKWNFFTQQYQTTSFLGLNYIPDPANYRYIGGGKLALMQNIAIFTKDFNPFVNQGGTVKMSYIDFQTDATANTAVSVKVLVDSSQSNYAVGNLDVGNKQSETALSQFGRVENITKANPGVVTAPHHGLQTGQSITFRGVQGMVEVNGVTFTITHISENQFSIVDTSGGGFTPYLAGTIGQWFTNKLKFYTPGSNYAWHRFYASCYGQYLAFLLFYDDNLMNTVDTHQQRFEMNAMQIWLRKGGRLPF